MAAGHRLPDLKEVYTIAQVQLFARALAWNREQEKLDQAEAIALGIATAFNPEAKILEKCQEALVNPDYEPEPAELKPEVMTALFGSVPIVEK